MLQFSAEEVGIVGTAYLIGAVIGAVLFGYLTDRFGRRRLFFVTLGLYLTATAATAFFMEFLELCAVPCADRRRHRRRVHGDQLGDPGVCSRPAFAAEPIWPSTAASGSAGRSGRRARFFSTAGHLAAGLGLARRLRDRRRAGSWYPGVAAPPAGEPALADAACAARRGRGGYRANRAPGCACRRSALPAPAGGRIRLAASSHTPIVRMVLAIVRDYPQRAVLGLVLMGSQAFFYNAIFFTYALVLTQFYAVPAASIGWYLLPFAIGNFFGPLLLGPLFDRIGRKPMIASTYAVSGVLLAIVGYLFREDLVDARS